MKESILRMLKTSGFVSGQTICEQLHVSRTAVWKYMKQLKEEGYEIESVTRKGYRLLASPDILSREELRTRIPPGLISGEIVCFKEIDSTNEEAGRRAVLGAPDGSLYVAEKQSRGKGRRGRSWSSPEGRDLFFSMLFRPDIPVYSAPMVTLAVALAACRAARDYAGQDCRIKWPNDIILHEKKICGILTEMGTESDQVRSLIIGIGFNLNRQFFEPEIAHMATSIGKETGREIRRLDFLSAFMTHFQPVYRQFLKDRSLDGLMDSYNDHLVNVGREVRILHGEEETRGTALGINSRGELIVEKADGTRQAVRSGEVSVRGIYGYV